ncbi:hypothetical protein UPYG_G00058890, partial [Umbra pygmaea]
MNGASCRRRHPVLLIHPWASNGRNTYRRNSGKLIQRALNMRRQWSLKRVSVHLIDCRKTSEMVDSPNCQLLSENGLSGEADQHLYNEKKSRQWSLKRVSVGLIDCRKTSEMVDSPNCQLLSENGLSGEADQHFYNEKNSRQWSLKRVSVRLIDCRKTSEMVDSPDCQLLNENGLSGEADQHLYNEKKSIYKTNLKKHKHTPTGKKPYGCDQCGKRF